MQFNSLVNQAILYIPWLRHFVMHYFLPLKLHSFSLASHLQFFSYMMHYTMNQVMSFPPTFGL